MHSIPPEINAQLHGLQVVDERNTHDILTKYHAIGHSAADGIVDQLLADRLWWPAMHKDATSLVLHCLSC